MKRAAALQPLSREHHGALLVAKKLTEADDLESARAAFLEFWEEDGRRHFRVEEEVLLGKAIEAAEVVRFAGVNHLLVELGYWGKTRLIEPYSLRRSSAGNLLLYRS